MKVVLTFVLSVATLTAGCGPAPEPALDEATVIAQHSSVRLKNSSTSRTLTTLQPGDRVDVVEQQGNWYRIRLGDIQGWMEESTVVTNRTRARIEELVAGSQGQAAQNTATLIEDANFRIEAGRNTPVVRRLTTGTMVEVLERVTLPRPGSDHLFDVWIKVRPTPTEVGWVIGTLVQFDVPADIAQYTEGMTYTAVKPINQVQDSIAGPVHWYVVGERRPGVGPHLDFDGIRVYTWNLRRHRYETAYRLKGLRGVYPLEVGQDGNNPTFRIFELNADGQEKTARDFVMNGVIVRESKKDTVTAAAATSAFAQKPQPGA